MNTISSVYYGWAWLIVCGGGSYYFAKRAINADRAERAALEAERRARRSRAAELQYRQSLAAAVAPSQEDGHANPSREQVEPSPGAGHRNMRSRFEASEPYISPKGDRFSTIGREQRIDSNSSKGS